MWLFSYEGTVAAVQLHMSDWRFNTRKESLYFKKSFNDIQEILNNIK